MLHNILSNQSWKAESFFALLRLGGYNVFNKTTLVCFWFWFVVFLVRFHVVFQVFYEALEHKRVCFISRLLWQLSQF